MGKVYYVVPHLARTGGIKVVLQHIHLLTAAGIPAECIAISTAHGNTSPFPRYTMTRLHIGANAHMITEEDTLVFVWPNDIEHYSNINCRKIHYAQGCLCTTNMPELHIPFSGIDKDYELWTIGSNSRTYGAMRYGKESKLVRNWIDTEVFKPGTKVPKTVGMITHRQNYNPELGNLLTGAGYRVVEISGSEEEVASKMGTCDYFIQCSPGLWNDYEYTEGFPLPGAEAMASGAILLTYDSRGVLEYAFDRLNSIVFNNPKELLKRVNEIEEDLNEKETMRQLGIDTMVKKFNSSIITYEIKRGLGLDE